MFVHLHTVTLLMNYLQKAAKSQKLSLPFLDRKGRERGSWVINYWYGLTEIDFKGFYWILIVDLYKSLLSLCVCVLQQLPACTGSFYICSALQQGTIGWVRIWYQTQLPYGVARKVTPDCHFLITFLPFASILLQFPNKCKRTYFPTARMA